jgi:hypothetical protein
MTVKILIALAPVALASAAFAQDDNSALAPLFACQSIADASERLACADAAISGLRTATESGSVVVVNRQQIEAAEQQSYGRDGGGFSLADVPSISLPSLTSESEDLADASTSTNANVVRDEEGQINRIENLPVASLRTNRRGRFVIELENGQVWVQTDSSRIWIPPSVRNGTMSVTVENAALGSHRMQIVGTNRWFRARRED